MCFTITVAGLLAMPVFTVSQEKRDPDGPEAILKELAVAFKDDRTIEQIKKDNGLIRAAANGDAEGILKALKGGALINSRYLDGYAFLDEGESGYTALMFAVLNKKTDAIKLLIEKKAELEIKHHEGWTVLYFAVVLSERRGRFVSQGWSKTKPRHDSLVPRIDQCRLQRV